MNETVISISDVCVRASQSGSVSYSEPGIALLMSGETPVLGNLAQNALRQQPTRINSRYWSDLNTDAIQINNTSVRHNADLVWHQLSQIKSKLAADLNNGSNALTICVPSNLNQQQLQLLTGICQSLELQVNSLINLGLAQLVGNLSSEGNGLESSEHWQEVTHIDLQLHQLVLTTYHVVDAKLELKDQEIIQSISFLRYIDRLLHLLQDKFIQSSRFDPLHSGDTEQQLFDQLIQMINTGEHSPFQVDTAQKQHKIELSSQELNSLTSDFKAELAKRLHSSGKLAYTPVFAQLPGFQLAGSEINLTTANTDDGAALLVRQQEPSDSIVFIRNASLKATRNNAQEPSQAIDENQPQAAKAKKTANAILLNHQVYQKSSYGQLIEAGISEGFITFTETGVINSDGQTLLAGDRLAVDDKELVAVQLAD